MNHKIAVIGSSGSVGVTLQEKLDDHPIFSQSQIDTGVESWSSLFKDKIKYEQKIRSIIKQADLIVLCVADEVALSIIKIIDDADVKIIDCSTTHRIDPDWTYGLPELEGQRKKIKNSLRVATPGCHATAAILTTAPLYNAEINDISCIPFTGYSGGVNGMIDQFEAGEGSTMAYSVGKKHKHKPEIEKYANKKMSFQPIVLNGEKQGIHMITTLPNISPQFVIDHYRRAYDQEPFVNLLPTPDTISIRENNQTNKVSLYVLVDEHNCQVHAVLDNLGKGSAGAVIQNANLMFGLEENCGL